MSPADVLEAIKSGVRVNLTHIDKVVVVCAGRLEKAHTDSIQAFLGWLSFTKHRDKFVFIYNKSDMLSSAEKQLNLLGMCDKFGAKINENTKWVTVRGDFVSLNLNLATGFPPGASFADVENDHTNLTRAVLCGSQHAGFSAGRIPVNKSACVIL